MKNLFRYIQVFSGLLVMMIVSCNPLKKIPQNDALYTGASLKIDSTPLSKKQKKQLQSDLKALIRPKPNKKFLGMRLKLTAYYAAGNPKKEKSIAGWLKYKVGEPPVLLSEVNIDRNVEVLQNTLENTGYFNAEVQWDSTIKGRTASLAYTVQTGNRYHINDVKFDTAIAILQQNLRDDTSSTLLKRGEPFSLALIKDERSRIDNNLKEKGFFYFDPDFIIVQVDSTIGNNKVNLYVKVKPSVPLNALKPYRINNIYIFANFRPTNTSAADTSRTNMEFYDGYYVLDRQHLYKPRLFEDAMQLSSGEWYNRTDHNATVSRLVNLGLFRYVRNRFETVQGIDSAMLNTYYYLSAMQRQALRSEVNASTKSNNLTGSSISLSWRKRNTFRAGELLAITASAGFEVQFGGQQKGYNTYRGGLEANLSFPRFVAPFHWKNKGGFVPKTNAIIGFDLMTKKKLYTLHSFSATYGFTWKTAPFNEHKLNPISINYVQPSRVSQEYLDSIGNNPSLAKTIQRQFIIGSNYNYNYSQIRDNIFMTGFYFNGNIDLSGNIIGWITGANTKAGKPVRLFNSFFSQYVRGEVDFRYYLKLSQYKVWINRVFLGGSVPYGNSVTLPFVKQFYAGGNNDLRGFRSRSVGPGTYQQPNIEGFLPDQSGDIKLEYNSELRAKLFSIVHGAIFVDAGNIWLYNDLSVVDTVNFKPGGAISKNFLKELAVDAGVGLRFDISFLVLRLDVGMPLRKPYLPDGERWVFNQIKLGSSLWRKDNLIFNLGIGYPF